MSFEELQKIRELQQRVSILEDLVKQMQITNRKQTLSLPVKPAKVTN